MSQSDCILCKVVTGEVRARKVVETDKIIGVINDAEPQSRGHVIFFPKQHGPQLIDMTDEDLAEMLIVIKRVAVVMQPENYNVLQNNGALAGQTVFHAHMHLIPKWSESEGLKYQWETRRDVDHNELYRKIKEALSGTAS